MTLNFLKMAHFDSKNSCIPSLQHLTITINIAILHNLRNASHLKSHATLHHVELGVGGRGGWFWLERPNKFILFMSLLEVHIFFYVYIPLNIFSLFYFFSFEFIIQFTLKFDLEGLELDSLFFNQIFLWKHYFLLSFFEIFLPLFCLHLCYSLLNLGGFLKPFLLSQTILHNN